MSEPTNEKLTRLQATVLIRVLQVALDPVGSPPLVGHEIEIAEGVLAERAMKAFSEAEK